MPRNRRMSFPKTYTELVPIQEERIHEQGLGFNQPLEHETDHREANKGSNCRSVTFEVAHQTAGATDPCE